MKKYVGYTLTVLLAAFTMVGCGKNSDSGQPAVVGTGIVNPYGLRRLPNMCWRFATVDDSDFAKPIASRRHADSNVHARFELPLRFGHDGADPSCFVRRTLRTKTAVCRRGTYTMIQPIQVQMQGNAVIPFQFQAQGPSGIATVTVQRMYFTSPTQFQVNGSMQGQYGQACQITYY